MALLVYASSSESGIYVPGHIVQVGCGSVGFTLPCATNADTAALAVRRHRAADFNSMFFIRTSVARILLWRICHASLRSARSNGLHAVVLKRGSGFVRGEIRDQLARGVHVGG